MARAIIVLLICAVVAGCAGPDKVPPSPAKEKPPEELFGACSEDDLANRTCK